MNSWKNRLTRPNRRKKVFSKSANRWLDEDEEKELERLLEVSQKKITDALANEADTIMKTKNSDSISEGSTSDPSSS